MFAVAHAAGCIVICWGVLGQITHPAGCMSQFIRFFGEQIMVLWKLALLRRRILIFSPPPVGVVCYRGGFLLTGLNVEKGAGFIFPPPSLSVLLLLPG